MSTEKTGQYIGCMCPEMELRAQIERLREDAERYRWLRNGNAYQPEDVIKLAEYCGFEVALVNSIDGEEVFVGLEMITDKLTQFANTIRKAALEEAAIACDRQERLQEALLSDEAVINQAKRCAADVRKLKGQE